MFGMGTQELLLVLVVTLVIFGPKRLPDLARSLGKALSEFRRATSELKQTVEADEQFREVSKSLKEAKAGVTQVFEEAVRQAEEPAATIHNTAFETETEGPKVLDDEALKAHFLSEAKEELRAKKAAEAPGGDHEKLPEKEL
jgi:TatA/E family protein of Tat protein translocase